MSNTSYDLLQMLIYRLERLSADSRWSHRASGIRGNIYRLLEGISPGNENTCDRMDLLVRIGFMILGEAAAEIPGENDPHDGPT